jgi:developmental checkpoint coupling sporulation initiation to replication initiation
MSLEFISDDALLEAYRKAIECNLDIDFINIFTEELSRRNLLPDDHISN